MAERETLSVSVQDQLDRRRRTPEMSVSPMERRAASRIGLIVAAIAVVLSVVWYLGARSYLARTVEQQQEESLKHSMAMLDYRVAQLQERLRAECWLMSEGSNLKSPLGTTSGIDEATIVDVLKDLSKLTGAQMLAVLTPQGRVQAVVGDEAFKGLDLSTSKFLKEAREAAGPVSGVWVVGDRVMYIGAIAMRYGDRIVAYMLHGAQLDKKTLDELHRATGTSVGLVVSARTVLQAPEDPAQRPGFEQAALEATSNEPLTLSLNGRTFVSRATQVEGVLPPAQIVWLRPLDQLPAEYETIRYLLWVPMFAALLLGIFFVWRTLRPTHRSGV